MALKNTWKHRPDLLKEKELSKEDQEFLLNLLENKEEVC